MAWERLGGLAPSNQTAHDPSLPKRGIADLIVPACLPRPRLFLARPRRLRLQLLLPAPALGEGDKIGSKRRPGLLCDEDLRICQTIHRAMVTVWLPAEWQDTPVERVADARHASGQQAHQHPPCTIGCGLSTKATVGHVLGIACEVGSRPPQSCTTRPRGQGLKASNRVVDDGIDGVCVCAMEGPASVHTGLKL